LFDFPLLLHEEYKNFIWEPEGKRQFKGHIRRTVLRLIPKKQNVTSCSEFIWLRTGVSGGLCEHCKQPLIHNIIKFLHQLRDCWVYRYS
jgi:hypothetical protein